MSRIRTMQLALCTLLAAACEVATTAPEPPVYPPVALTVLYGDAQVGSVLSALRPFEVQALATGDVPLTGINVEWSVTEGAGTLSHAVSTTGPAVSSDGILRPLAISVLTLGASEGSYTVSARLPAHPGVAAVRFAATAVGHLIDVDAPDYWGCFYYGLCTGRFEPASIRIPAGTTVGWRWSGEQCDVVFEDAPSAPVSSRMQSERSHLRTFTEPGTYRFRCTLYSTGYDAGMVGVVHVE